MVMETLRSETLYVTLGLVLSSIKTGTCMCSLLEITFYPRGDRLLINLTTYFSKPFELHFPAFLLHMFGKMQLVVISPMSMLTCVHRIPFPSAVNGDTTVILQF